MSVEERTFEIAQEVATLLGEKGVKVAVIGAIATAVHGYTRATEDFDLAALTDPFTVLRDVALELKRRGYDAEVVLPDAEDPLGGVLNVDAAGADRVQVVNYFNPWRGEIEVGKDAVETAEADVLPPFRVVDIPHLVALKLYAGGRKSELDVLELLDRNPDAVEATRIVCRKFGFEEALTRLLAF